MGMEYKTWVKVKAALAHRQKPVQEWEFSDVTKEFSVVIRHHLRRVGHQPQTRWGMQITHRKRTLAGLRYLEKSLGLTPQEVAAYIPDYISRLGGDPVRNREAPWLEFLLYSQVRALARRRRSSDGSVERERLRAVVLSAATNHCAYDPVTTGVRPSREVVGE